MIRETNPKESGSSEQSSIAAAVASERERCAAIVELARFGEMDTDFRTIIHFIHSGLSVDEIRNLSK